MTAHSIIPLDVGAGPRITPHTEGVFKMGRRSSRKVRFPFCFCYFLLLILDVYIYFWMVEAYLIALHAHLLTCDARGVWRPCGRRHGWERWDMGNWPKGEIGSNEACAVENEKEGDNRKKIGKKTKADVDNYNGTRPWQSRAGSSFGRSIFVGSVGSLYSRASFFSYFLSFLNDSTPKFLYINQFFHQSYTRANQVWSTSWTIDNTDIDRVPALMFIGHESRWLLVDAFTEVSYFYVNYILLPDHKAWECRLISRTVALTCRPSWGSRLEVPCSDSCFGVYLSLGF